MTMDNGQQQAATDLAAADNAATDTPTDPFWEKSWDDAGIPELLRPKLRDSARTSAANVQKAIEQSRGGGVPPEWQAFIGSAGQAGVSPQDLLNAWNAAQAIREDPAGFARDLQARIAELEASGQITPAQAQQARAEGAQQIAEATGSDGATLNMKTPEQEQLEQLQAWQQQEIQRQQNQQVEQENQQIMREANDNAQAFGRELLAQLNTAGYNVEDGSLNDDVVGAVGRIAASALDSDQTGTLTHQAAVQTALQTLIRVSGGPKPVAQPVQQVPQPGQVPVQWPIGGGRGAPAVGQAPTFPNTNDGRRDAKAYRAQLMMEEGLRQQAAGISNG